MAKSPYFYVLLLRSKNGAPYKASLRKEPSEPIDVDLVRAQHACAMCPICNSIGFLLCAQCEDGCVPFLGGLQECSRCRGARLTACFICENGGKITVSY
jgi:hypothetical protein